MLRTPSIDVLNLLWQFKFYFVGPSYSDPFLNTSLVKNSSFPILCWKMNDYFFVVVFFTDIV